MNAKELKMVSSVITSMLKIKKQDYDEGVLMVFGMTLGDYPFQDVMTAIKKINTEGVKYMLEPHHIIEAIRQSPEELEMEAREQWIEFRDAVISRPNPKFYNPIKAYIAQSVISIFECKQMTDEQFYRKENSFIKAYISGDKMLDEIEAKCLRGEVKMVTDNTIRIIQDAENKRLGIGYDGKQIGEG